MEESGILCPWQPYRREKVKKGPHEDAHLELRSETQSGPGIDSDAGNGSEFGPDFAPEPSPDDGPDAPPEPGPEYGSRRDPK